jgi:hypothetical protein
MRLSPKLKHDETRQRTWYPYYAGFSHRFVETLIPAREHQAQEVLDPWNGAGSTTHVAWLRGQRARGFDVNPAMVLVAKSKLLGPSVHGSLTSLTQDIVAKATGHLRDAALASDLLSLWFSPITSQGLRTLEMSIRRLLISADATEQLAASMSLEHVSSLAAFFYTALFRTAKLLVASLRSSNPTWLRRPQPSERISLCRRDLFKLFRSEVRDMQEQLNRARVRPESHISIAVGDSRNLPVGDETVDRVITSPPYCTRIDYVIATQLELAIMGADSACIRRLRDQMIGTPTIHTVVNCVPLEWGPTCATFLYRVARHSSVSSDRYYLRNLAQYFDGLNRSTAEISRSLRRGGVATLVVQDSYYKDIHNDLPVVLTEMMTARGLTLADRHDFSIERTFGAINARSRKYRRSASAVEAVLTFTKSG